MVRLQVKRDKRIKRDFPIEQAEKILNMPQNGGWELDQDTDYKFEDGIIKSTGVKRKKDTEQSDS